MLIDDHGRVIELGLPLTSQDGAQAQYIGLTRLSPRGLRRVEQIYDDARRRGPDDPWIRGRSINRAFMTDLLQKLIDEGERVGAISIKRGWLEVDEPTDLERYREALGDGAGLPYYDPTL